MISKIEFVYSRVYDGRYREDEKIKARLKEKRKKYPSKNKIINYIKEIEDKWKFLGIKILKEISKVTGLKWRENKIKVYVVGFVRPFSDPLTMRLFRNKNDFIDVLTHELIHQIQGQNSEKFKKWFSYVDRKYKNEQIATKKHISVHAIHFAILIKLFDKKRLARNIKKDSDQDYKRAWQIVEEEGYDNIIRKFKEITK